MQVPQQTIVSPHLLPSRILATKYDRLFHFFLSKSIKKLVDREDCNEASQLKEIEFLDDDREMLKRTYDTEEFEDRIGILVEISHPPGKFHLIEPLVVMDPFRKIMRKRTKRIKKMEQKLQEIEEDVPVTFDSKFLDSVDSHSEIEQISYDSEQYDIFEQCWTSTATDVEKMAKVCVRGVSVLGTNLQPLMEPPQHLTMDFDDANQEEIILSYKKLTGKESFKRKYQPKEDPRGSFRKKQVDTTKLLSNQLRIEPYDGQTLHKHAHHSPKLYNHSNRPYERHSGKRITYLEPADQSIETQNQNQSNRKDIYKPNTLLQLNHNRQFEAVSNPTSIRSPTSNTTEFKAIRKRALELLSQDSQQSPKLIKTKSPATFTIQRPHK